VYVTVEGFSDPLHSVRVAYRSVDGGGNWEIITSNLPSSPANSIVVDPQDANTVYLATDNGVYSTRQIAMCATAASHCWAVYGTGLPHAPVVQLSAAPATATLNVLAAATYGRGVWQIPLWTAGTQLTTATASPALLSFATEATGVTSPAQAVTLTNTGGIALAPTAIVVSGDFSESDNCANAIVNAGGSCAIQVTFTPAQAGDRTGQLTISANVPGGQFVVALDGTGASPESVSLAPGTLSFGQVQVGSTSVSLQVTAGNSSGVAVPILSVNVTGPFVLATNACGSSLAANSSCELSIEFAPNQAGPASGTLTLTSGAGTQTVGLSGTGASAPTDVLSPTSVNFPATVTGQLSAAQTVVLTNGGDLPLTAISATVSVGFQTANNCGTTLAGNSSCSISVIFAPTQAGSLAGTLSVADAQRTQMVALSGTGLKPPAFGVSPTQASFSAQPVGTASVPLTLTVSNTGGAPMANVGFQITGQAAGSFTTGITTCGATLNSGSTCTVQVIFTPAGVGSAAASLVISSSTAGVMPVQVPLSGLGQGASEILLSPAQMSFSEATLGQATAAQTATITNSSNATASGLTISVTAPFSVTQNTCGSSLAAGANCAVGIAFTPSANGTVSGSLTVSSTVFTTPAILSLSGSGGAAGSVQMQPGSLSFATTGVGTVSSAQAVTVTNSSTVALTNLVLSVSSEFQLASSTCTATLVAGASCTASVDFAPKSAGQQAGNLTVASSMLAANAQVPLSGMGFDFTASITGGSSQTVASGLTARYTLSLAPANGSAGTFTFSCGTLPAHAACSFNPTSESVAANMTGSLTVQIATGQASASAEPARGGRWEMMPLACGLLMLPLAWRSRRKALLFLAVLAFVALGVASCSGGGGGGGSTPPPNSTNNTPAGTYSVDVTASAGGVSHKVTVSLTVD
jgi:hypothetical protein